MNHKWKKEPETIYGQKLHVCKNCSVFKEWYGGDFQCWHYFWHESSIAVNGSIFTSTKTSFERPDCKLKPNQQ